MRPRAGVVAVVMAFVAVAGLGAGCEDKRLDLRNLEGIIRDRYGREAGVPVTDVTCPEVVRTRKGDTFDCTVTLEGGAVWTITVTQLGEGKTRLVSRQAADPGGGTEAGRAGSPRASDADAGRAGAPAAGAVDGPADGPGDGP